MTSTRFVTMLEQYLVRFRATAEALAEARLLGQPAEDAEATLLRTLVAYAWTVHTRSLQLPVYPALPRSAAELHTRLSIVEILVALRVGKAPVPEEAEPNAPPPTPTQWQRLASAESRVFHFYQVAPLN